MLTADRAAARAKLNAGNRTVILSFGGSLGADRINQVVADLCAWEKQTHRNVLHLHATGSRGVKLFEGLEKEKDFADVACRMAPDMKRRFSLFNTNFGSRASRVSLSPNGKYLLTAIRTITT